jgi:hypothetical protein
MAEAIVQEATPKKVAFMSKPKNIEERIKKDEKELEKLLQGQKEEAKEKAEAELLSIHPDFEQIRETDDFHEWAEKQPKWVQNALYENDNDAKSAARAIDLYKADKNIINQKPSKDAAKAVNAKGQRSEPQSNDSKSYIKESDVQAMSAEEYEKKADTIMEAIRSGKFIYDLSGSAR